MNHWKLSSRGFNIFYGLINPIDT